LDNAAEFCDATEYAECNTKLNHFYSVPRSTFYAPDLMDRKSSLYLAVLCNAAQNVRPGCEKCHLYLWKLVRHAVKALVHHGCFNVEKNYA